MEALASASWRVKAAIGCLVFAKINSLAAAMTIMGMFANGQLRGLAVSLMACAGAGVAGALGLALAETKSVS